MTNGLKGFPFHYLANDFVQMLYKILRVILFIREINRMAIGSIMISLFWSGDVRLLREKKFVT